MAGGHHNLRHDPAIERWYQMREDIYKNFRFTPYATRRVLIWGLAVPALTLYLLHDQAFKWDLRGKKHGETLKRVQN
ncbi:hypothetical protein M408DRAFT_332012 [Serendipita vermifera MAFF 305830]|uniref:NADH dehydrogenase [ubiquinone] 1 beta subcomplex subunit 4 n=1 Tax=Serendipita vermifera MAFF 305830 TaxID=933852 RepID=A0A0C3AR62_SERVB|nr:hypothetical protein M408DRAFT_333302 [Serendipita vermifera MAFF 305830]KIM23945.1 hypothetical protein M408DRAFT_332012 [Serendipita vermifera MAFF 305830]